MRTVKPDNASSLGSPKPRRARQSSILAAVLVVSAAVLQSGCAVNEPLSTFEMVRLRQTAEAAEKQRQQAETHLEELKANNAKIEEQLHKLTERATAAEHAALECESRGREHGVVLPEASR